MPISRAKALLLPLALIGAAAAAEDTRSFVPVFAEDGVTEAQRTQSCGACFSPGA